MLRAFIVICLLPSVSLATDAIKPISMDEVEALIKKKASVVIYDANVESTRANVGVLPGAKLLPQDSEYDVKKELPSDKSARLIFYCANPMCSASQSAAERAVTAGYKNVSVMKDGVYGWKKAGKTLEKVAQPTPVAAIRNIDPGEAADLVKHNKAVIVDVREGEERHEYLQKAVWMPMSKFNDADAWHDFRHQLPKDKVIVFHCAAGLRARKAAEKLALDGYKTQYIKGADQWKALGLPIAKGL